MREYNDFKYACLFGGGAIRGAAHVGVLKALHKLGIESTLLAGSSVGSISTAISIIRYFTTPPNPFHLINGIFNK